MRRHAEPSRRHLEMRRSAVQAGPSTAHLLLVDYSVKMGSNESRYTFKSVCLW